MILFFFINIAHAGVITEATPISRMLYNILNFVLQVCGTLAIISLVVSGIFYFLSAGDAERAKEAKKMVGYSVIGIAIAAGAMVILRGITSLLV